MSPGLASRFIKEAEKCFTKTARVIGYELFGDDWCWRCWTEYQEGLLDGGKNDRIEAYDRSQTAKEISDVEGGVLRCCRCGLVIE